MPFRRFGRPGLLGAVARTAVIAGTATAVSGAVADRQQRAAVQRADAEAYEDQRAVAAASIVPSSQVDLMAELERLAALRQQGLLTDGEFAAAKQRLLAS